MNRDKVGDGRLGVTYREEHTPARFKDVLVGSFRIRFFCSFFAAFTGPLLALGGKPTTYHHRRILHSKFVQTTGVTSANIHGLPRISARSRISTERS